MSPFESAELVALIHDLDLKPRNYWASDFFQIVENDQLRAYRDKQRLSAFYNRNHSRPRVHFSSRDSLFEAFES